MASGVEPFGKSAGVEEGKASSRYSSAAVDCVIVTVLRIPPLSPVVVWVCVSVGTVPDGLSDL
ncbi:hypothetical protein BFW01_g3242 [Lasiodiplodia theobromae]|nr:hypothetical protein BFW01_g3242 [Lasiodiplodia theobromae]